MPVSKSRLVASWLNSIYRDQPLEEIQSSSGSAGLPVEYVDESYYGQVLDVLDIGQDSFGKNTTKIFHTSTGGESTTNTPAIVTTHKGIVVTGDGYPFTPTYSDGVLTNGIGFKARDLDYGNIGSNQTANPSIVSNFNAADIGNGDTAFADMSHMRCDTAMSYRHFYNDTTGRYPVNLITQGAYLGPTFSQMRAGQEVLLIISLNGNPIIWPSGLTWLNNGGLAPTVAAGKTLSVVVLRTNVVAPSSDTFNAWVLGIK
jgi:hypothetical protein